MWTSYYLHTTHPQATNHPNTNNTATMPRLTLILPKRSFRAGLAKWVCVILVLICLIARQEVIIDTLASFQPSQLQKVSYKVSYDSNNNNNNTMRTTSQYYRDKFMVNISYRWPSTEEIAVLGSNGSRSNTNEENEPTFLLNKEHTEDTTNNNDLSSMPLPSFVTENNLTGHVDPSTGRLTVQVDHTYAFWQQGQSKLCQLLRNMTNKVSLEDDYYARQGNNRTATSPPLPLLNMTIDCEWLATNEGFGQGNWVTAFYAVRMATTLAQVDFQFQCTTLQASRSTLLLPWLEGYYPAPTNNNTERWPYDDGENIPTQAQVCSDKYSYLRIDKLAHEIQSDMRRMAHTILQEENNDSIVLDDVAIHFRCGDIMGGVRRSDFGMIQFTEYLKWIPATNSNITKTIGILTQPFEKDRNRVRDGRKSEDCRQATYLLVDYLQAHYPHTQISIRNDRNETLPITYARLVGAQQSFTSLSSFGIFPVIGTMGEGYFQRGNRGVNPFATYIPNYLSNIHEMNAPKLSSAQIQQRGLNATLAWFVNGTTTRR